MKLGVWITSLLIFVIALLAIIAFLIDLFFPINPQEFLGSPGSMKRLFLAIIIFTSAGIFVFPVWAALGRAWFPGTKTFQRFRVFVRLYRRLLRQPKPRSITGS